MKYVNLGNSDIKISAMGLGCMGMTHAYGLPSDEGEMTGLIHSALDMGITFFDTAQCYTATGLKGKVIYNEELVGRALKPYRNKAVIATKFGVRHNKDRSLVTDSSPHTIHKSLDDSLKRLGTDYIDLYYQHRIDPDIPPEEVAGVMKDLIQEGKIREWGISEADEDYIRRAYAVCHPVAVQNRYSMMYRYYEDLLPVLDELKITLVAHSPLANGFLSGRYNKDYVFDRKNDYRSDMPQFKKEGIEQNKELLEMLNKMSAAKNATPAQISLAWLMSKDIVPIPGTRRLDRLKENIGSVNITLTKTEAIDIDIALTNMEMSEVFGGHKRQVKS